jgi:hypothetical protein
MNTTYTTMIQAAIQGAAADFETNEFCRAVVYSRKTFEKYRDQFKRFTDVYGYVGAYDLFATAITTASEPPDEDTCDRLLPIFDELSEIIYKGFREGKAIAPEDVATADMLNDIECVAITCAAAGLLKYR